MTVKPTALRLLGRDDHNHVVVGRNWISGDGGRRPTTVEGGAGSGSMTEVKNKSLGSRYQIKYSETRFEINLLV